MMNDTGNDDEDRMNCGGYGDDVVDDDNDHDGHYKLRGIRWTIDAFVC